MYNLLKQYLTEKNIFLGKEMFSAVLLDLQFREAGNTTRISNALAYGLKLYQTSDGFKIDKDKFEYLSRISTEVWKTK
ncbi:hypothetical protein [Lactococcus allomyrinae]|uniref:Uncharacterized protein n=1 Tax=Lactococcus allomyrinae TaxID=2419773 RepID=A0A387BDR8_9LACT|nr:hypothetical protein [Lactococcus allomyrinae]AYF99808.1 hypothetical protein D7I46_01135 [Lactococcus allomyrinae]